MIFPKETKFHLIGIKGTGMASLATVLKDLGYNVTGSDVKDYFFTEKNLIKNKIKYTKFSLENIEKDKIYIVSSCYDESNIELRKVKEEKLPYFYYHEAIGQFFEGIKIGISGTHGKTTTTTLVQTLFKNKKKAVIIGDSSGTADIDYDFFIFEACEYKNHFLNYTYDYLVINNIDFDHPDYFNNIDDVIDSFQKAAIKAKTIIVNSDDKNTEKIIHQNKITFGMNKQADIFGEIISENEKGYYINVKCFQEEKTFFLNVHGKHMISNFLASVAVSYLNGITLDEMKINMKYFNAPLRRMEEHQYFDNIIIDDYAHHPKEIVACIDAIKQKYKNKRIVVIFQPHTYSRTIFLKDEFKKAFVKADEVYLEKTFTSKREKESIEKDIIVMKALEIKNRFDDESLRKILRYHNHVILFLGAGTVNSYIEKIMKII